MGQTPPLTHRVSPLRKAVVILTCQETHQLLLNPAMPPQGSAFLSPPLEDPSILTRVENPSGSASFLLEHRGGHVSRAWSWSSASTGSADRLLSQPSACFAFTLVFLWESTHSHIPEGTGDSNRLVYTLDPVCLCSSMDQGTEAPWSTFSLETRQGRGSQTIASSFLVSSEEPV